MEFTWSDEDRDVRARAREFTESFLFPYEMHIEETDTPDPDTEARIVRGLNDYALNAANQPREFGGQGMSVVQQCILWEEAGKATNALWGRVWMPPICLQAGTPDQIQKYLVPSCSGQIISAFCTSEPEAGSDAGGLKTHAVVDGSDYVINGEKCFASNAEFADFMLLTTFVDGDPAKATVFLVDKGAPGVSVRRLPHFTARTGWGHPELDITDLRVPAAQILGEVGQGFEMTKDWFVEARLGCSGRAVGAAIRATDLALSYASERQQFGSRIVDFQGIEFMLAENATDIMAAKSMLYRLAAEIDAGLDRKTAHARASSVKLFTSEMAFRVLDKCQQIFGGRGLMRENPVERLVRDVRFERVWEGTSEIQKVVIADQLKKRGMALYAD
jgi:alkylation response protein AidB-like acyl-CoA dehydrogenase